VVVKEGGQWVRWSLLAGILAALLAAGGCGYRLAAPAGGRGGQSIAIPVFANKSLRPNVDACLTARLVDFYAAAHGGRIVSSDQAELLLTGAVLAYRTSTSAYDAADKAAMIRLEMSAEATLSERASGTVLWRGQVTAEQDYPANRDNLALQLNAEAEAQSELCRKLAAEIIRRSGQSF
jgi:outer membrane lipopolysaccharide assembly protein LptE/RlpB